MNKKIWEGLKKIRNMPFYSKLGYSGEKCTYGIFKNFRGGTV